MKNKDIFTIDRKLFLRSKFSPTRVRVDWDKVIDTLSVFGLVLVVGLWLCI
jgi:hypothetical protein